MNGNGVACEGIKMNNESSLQKVEMIFDKIQQSIEAIRPLITAASEAGSAFPQFEDDLYSISSACDLFAELVTKERAIISDKIHANALTDEHLKEARHDLRAKVGAILGYSELIQEELMDEGADNSAAYAEILNQIAEYAKNLIPVIDGLRVDDVVQAEDYSTNENTAQLTDLRETDLSYGEQYAHCTVLIIDDSAYNREILSRRLSRYGVHVMTADNGAKGIEMVSQHPVDLILLDIMMPVMNGYEALTHLKDNLDSKNIPVLMISALSEVDSIVRCIEAGAEDYLPTPFNPVILHARIKACLEKKILRDREQENLDKLELARQKLETAIESIEDGFAVFDHDQHLSLCNQQFQNLYPGVEKLGYHGFTYEELLRENLQLGVYFEERRRIDQKPNDTDELENWVRLYVAHQKSSDAYLVRLRDGRWIEVVNSSTPDGGQVSVHKDVTDRKEDEDRLTFMALHDPLTGLSNRSAFETYLDESFKRCENAKGHFSLMFLDLDGFKNINDTLGHDVGDQVLIYVSEALKSCVRAGDVVARLGGDEFAIILAEPGDRTTVSQIADRILIALGTQYSHEGQQVPYGVSIGVALYPGDGKTPEELLASSDSAMYAAKKAGKGHYRFFEDLKNNKEPESKDVPIIISI
jgi:two-component system, cell cycle response regulator